MFVAFVVVAMLDVPWDCINVLFCCELATPKYVDDPILAVRRGVYEVSVAHRTGGWKGRLAALERAGPPFLL
jgi:hypothetical protein